MRSLSASLFLHILKVAFLWSGQGGRGGGGWGSCGLRHEKISLRDFLRGMIHLQLES